LSKPTSLPLLPTSVIGSYALPGWFWSAVEQIDQDAFGTTEIRETFDDAVNIALMDQERAGVDVITDGEMRRWYFVQSFYKRFEGLVPRPTLRKTGEYGYDSVPRWWAAERIKVPNGLGIVEEYAYTRAVTDKPLKATCPGPLTLTIHIQLKDGDVYKDRMELAFEFADCVNRELKGLVDAGADFIQLDEPSYSIIPGSSRDWIDLFNRTVDGVDAKVGLHICFGNLGSRPRGKRRYGWMLDDIMRSKADQISLEFANREMIETELCAEIAKEKEVAAGIVDVKSYYLETAEDVAERVRQLLEFVPPEKLWITPDCGFFQLPRWLAFQKMQRMVQGVAIVRKELTG
jgi:5-methyltetrahydropteroyltriglutamate--homocysteine methyltransferase